MRLSESKLFDKIVGFWERFKHGETLTPKFLNPHTVQLYHYVLES